MKPKKTSVRSFVVMLLAAVALGVPATAPAQPTATAARMCTGSYTTARIGGAIKCLRSGEFCARRYASQYRRYGFICESSGRLEES
jgi:hypothetical protein